MTDTERFVKPGLVVHVDSMSSPRSSSDMSRKFGQVADVGSDENASRRRRFNGH